MLTRLRGALSTREWRRLGLLAAAVVGLHALGFALLLAVVVPHHYAIGRSGFFGLGIGVTAYTLGLRHAFDADHIGAIDNTTRKLMADGQRPLSVGFFFSLGHSTVVFALGVLVALGVRGASGALTHSMTSVVGPLISGSFLFLVGVVNLVVLVGIVASVRGVRRGDYDDAALERQLASRGLMNRIYGRAARAVTRPRQMYGVGLLFGLGFDTATEVALLVLAGAGAAARLPFYAILCLPILFAAGMSLLDTIDGAFMNFAYGWAFSKPARKLFYNIAITALSVAVALMIGTIELVSVVANRLSLNGGIWGFVSRLDLNAVGYVIVGLFVLTWAGAVAVWRLAHIEERWGTKLQGG